MELLLVTEALDPASVLEEKPQPAGSPGEVAKVFGAPTRMFKQNDHALEASLPWVDCLGKAVRASGVPTRMLGGTSRRSRITASRSKVLARVTLSFTKGARGQNPWTMYTPKAADAR